MDLRGRFRAAAFARDGRLCVVGGGNGLLLPIVTGRRNSLLFVAWKRRQSLRFSASPMLVALALVPVLVAYRPYVGKGSRRLKTKNERTCGFSSSVFHAMSYFC